jgi:hypothetical protein
MSSRALRKLRKQRQQGANATLLVEEQEAQHSDQELVETVSSKPNAFELLNVTGEDGDESDKAEMASAVPENLSFAKKPAGPKKKKKKKAAKLTGPSQTKADSSEDVKLDEIDRALKALSATQVSEITDDSPSRETCSLPSNGFLKTAEELLAIEPKFLNAINEMRKLFGDAVLESFDQNQSGGMGRRRERRRETVDLGRALTGQYSPASGGRSLAGLTLRKNVLMQGKDEWPRAPSGGLGMEVSEKLPSNSTIYRIIYNSAYQDVQRQFNICVESMQPQRLIQLLQYNRKFHCPFSF